MISVGIDIGGTNIKLAVMDNKYKIIETSEIKTKLNSGYSSFIKNISNLINSIKTKYHKRLYGCCIAIAGDVDGENGFLRFSPNLKGWKNKNIKKDIERLTGINCFVDNDANMAAFGSYVFDLKRKYKNVVVFTLGTGIGGGIILNHHLYHGSTSSAGEFGHNIIVVGGKKCACGNYGCLEAYCSTKSIVEKAKKKWVNIKRYIDKYGDGDNHITPKLIYNAAVDGNIDAIKIWDEYGYMLGIGIGNAVISLNPDVVVLCGGISRASKFFMPSLKKRLAEYRIKTPMKWFRILVSNYSNIGVFGCAAFVFETRK